MDMKLFERLNRLKKSRKSYIVNRLAGVEWKLCSLPETDTIRANMMLNEALRACEYALRTGLLPVRYEERAKVLDFNREKVKD